MESIESIFAQNLKRRRRELSLTQKELAARLGYSEKAISKWESGNCMPPAAILPALAGLLSVSIDSLVCHKADIAYYLGIDGGGTKTEFCLKDSTGNTVSTLTLGASNPNDVGFDAACDVIMRGTYEICGDIPRYRISIFAGIAGILTGDYQKRLYSLLECQRFGRSNCGSDAQNAISAAIGNSDGVAVIMGTGSIAFTQRKGKLFRTGGYGYLLGDGGSGFAIGRDGINAALRAEDGSGESTLLLPLLRTSLDTEKLLDKLSAIYAGGKRFIAGLAPKVFEAFEAGDAIAAKILDANMRDIASVICGAAAHLGGKDEINAVLCGGLTSQYETLAPMLKKHLQANEKIKISVCSRSMVEGALLLAGMEEGLC